MKIAIGQMNVVAAAVAHNLNTMKMMIDQAKLAKAELIVFPELCLSGYWVQDKWFDETFNELLQEANSTILQWSDGIGILYGNVYQNTKEKTRCNAAYFCHNQQWGKHENGLTTPYIKQIKQDEHLFEDSRYFTAGALNNKDEENKPSPFLFETHQGTFKIGVLMDQDGTPIKERGYEGTLDILVHLSVTPWTKAKEKMKVEQNLELLNNTNAPYLIDVQNCGMQNSGKTIAVFDGGSAIYHQGKMIACANDNFKEELLIGDENHTATPTHNPEKVLDALLCAIQEVDQQFFNASMNWIIGLSGGLDSTINAALFCMALSPQRVIGYNMATRYNSIMTKDNARNLAQQLGMMIREGSIEKLVEATEATLKAYGYQEAYPSLVYENIQARLRGHLLSTFASVENGVIVNNGNKVEVALGYCTLYGDAIGAFCPLADCTKVQLFDLAKMINRRMNQEIIPLNLLPDMQNGEMKWETPPSAELKDAQKDPMKWFYHDWLVEQVYEEPKTSLEELMEAYLNGSLLKSDIGKWLIHYGLDEPQAYIQDLEWFRNTIQRNAFKRFQMPPAVMITSGAFGSDIQEAQLKMEVSPRYLTLKAQILAMGQGHDGN